MKWVYLNTDNTVREIIPDEATQPSIAHWYGKDFASRCVQALDEVEQGWVYDGTTFSPPHEPEPAPAVDQIVEVKLAIAELAEAQATDTLAIQLAIAELAEALLGGE